MLVQKLFSSFLTKVQVVKSMGLKVKIRFSSGRQHRPIDPAALQWMDRESNENDA